jgi:putative cardiolipin synthase
MNFGKTNMERLPIRECPKTSFATDLPGATSWDRIKVSSYKEKFRVTERAFGERLRKSEKALISSPYFMLNTRSGKLMDDLVDAGVELKFLTNSLGSTDAFYVAAAFYRVVNDWRDIGIDTYVHTSKYHENGNLVVFPEVKKAKWGMHQKSHVYFYRDGTSGIMVGTYNVDNRSSFYNNELAVFCDGSDALTQDVYQDALERVENNSSLVVGKELAKFQNQEPSKEDYYGNASQKEIKRIKLIKAPIEALQFLL